ncbi:arginine N-methyltransferase-like protein [Thermochaetoides thermophila DSM 1495]|uniref:type I protein arginine methyltransferase n=1 Tax=Chaetomium thermophilum (strain DSM 1495 / CBS 144.50 / IMI 039719) TaxID=759272 RepID=G0S055_CHATD|nr:arginine N-methyltransferase-like protein [Thermochaetoides thermophila DSM 1495]EGS23216.1 arginine N-methyltransferase-like protein [Thermochaetoides thermophila DSM 1495]
MLKDTIRTCAYRDFIYANKNLFRGKTVLDIGCGTGILSLFCARAGAARVIAVDNAAPILEKSRLNVFHNNLSDVITCISGRIEDVTLPVDKVDIIVSEWMGYCLLYEAMLPSVLYARDRYLKPGGLLVPSHASMWLAPVADADYVMDNIDFWRDVYGFDMSKAMQADIYRDGRVVTMPPSSVCGKPYAFRMLDLHTAKTEDLAFEDKWMSVLHDASEAAGERLDGFLVWFDIFFGESPTEKIDAATTAAEWVKHGRERVAFTTGPFGGETHWRQGLFLIDQEKAEEIEVEKGKKLEGTIEYAVAAGHARGLDIRVTWKHDSGKIQSQTWRLH